MKNKNQATSIFANLSIGHRNAVSRPYNKGIDRCLRKLIEEANIHGDLIIHGENGYYRPDLDDPYDRIELQRYLNNERSRIRTLIRKHTAMLKEIRRIST